MMLSMRSGLSGFSRLKARVLNAQHELGRDLARKETVVANRRCRTRRLRMGYAPIGNIRRGFRC